MNHHALELVKTNDETAQTISDQEIAGGGPWTAAKKLLGDSLRKIAEAKPEHRLGVFRRGLLAVADDVRDGYIDRTQTAESFHALAINHGLVEEHSDENIRREI